MIDRKHRFEPTSNSTEPIWVSTPQRTTADLVSSCVLTLILCVWTAVHLNIPSPLERGVNSGRKRKSRALIALAKRVKWMLIALFAPELVLYTAFDQFIEARAIAIELNKIDALKAADKQVLPSSFDTVFLAPFRPGLERFHSFLECYFPPGLEKGFYIVMGGYKFMLPEREIYPPDTRKAFILTNPRTVTPQGAMVLARYGKLPVMKVEDINDKSKADALTKTLVCLQAIWMLIQCIARKAQQLPVTLLEINTVMHVVCALCMYLLWMRKPQNVSQPTVLD
ncbi:hypothetical protein DFH27DRAFT_480753, partial [Peziza echinospora]